MTLIPVFLFRLLILLLMVKHQETETMLRSYLKDEGVKTNKVEEIVENVFHQIFYFQGLEFSNFIKTNDFLFSVSV